MTQDQFNLTPEEFEQLLPWYVSGTLSVSEKQKFEAFLKQHPEFSLQVDLACEEHEEVVFSNENAGMPSSGALDKLMSDIAKESPVRAEAPSQGKSLLAFFIEIYEGFRPYALAAACGIIVMQAFAMTVFLQGQVDPKNGVPEVRYQTASKKSDKVDVQKGSHIYVLFQENASVAQVTDLLDELDARIVEGPEPNGMFKVKISDKALPDQDRESLIAKFKAKTDLVEFILPAE